jgi:hypothetical protein
VMLTRWIGEKPVFTDRDWLFLFGHPREKVLSVHLVQSSKWVSQVQIANAALGDADALRRASRHLPVAGHARSSAVHINDDIP